MRKLASLVILPLSLLALLLAGCGGPGGTSSAGSNELDLGPSNFQQTSLTISAGQALHIVDGQQTGGTHNLCFGQNGQCNTNATGPAVLHSPGMPISPGITKDITFDTAGTYHITCTIHPWMNFTLTVQ